MNAAERQMSSVMARAAQIPGLQRELAAAAARHLKAAQQAQRRYKDFHWGRQARRVRAGQAPMVYPGDVLTELGKLLEVAYLARKGSDPMTVYEHEFRRPLPVLAATDAGQLVVLGGAYRISSRGIVG